MKRMYLFLFSLLFLMSCQLTLVAGGTISHIVMAFYTDPPWVVDFYDEIDAVPFIATNAENAVAVQTNAALISQLLLGLDAQGFCSFYRYMLLRYTRQVVCSWTEQSFDQDDNVYLGLYGTLTDLMAEAYRGLDDVGREELVQDGYVSDEDLVLFEECG